MRVCLDIDNPIGATHDYGFVRYKDEPMRWILSYGEHLSSMSIHRFSEVKKYKLRWVKTNIDGLDCVKQSIKDQHNLNLEMIALPYNHDFVVLSIKFDNEADEAEFILKMSE